MHLFLLLVFACFAGLAQAQDPQAEQNRSEFLQYFQNELAGHPEAVHRVVVDAVAIYKQPDRNADPIGQLPRDVYVHVLHFTEEWAQIGSDAWILRSAVKSLALRTR